MINSVSIQNYKCFKDFSVQGFRLLNLFGGRNNVGKSNLLEAMYLGLNHNKLSEIARMRNTENSNEFHKTFYYNYDFENKPVISLTRDSNVRRISILNEANVKVIKAWEITSNNSIILSKDVQFPILYSINKTFDTAEKTGNEAILKKALKIIDADIENARTFSDSNYLHIKKENSKIYIPLFAFGDALEKIMRYVVTIYNLNEEGAVQKCLFIDEIENGLHYTAQAEFWKMLFDLAIAFDIQIFATSHSLEMIKAFNEVARKNNFENHAMYFEMAKTSKTNKIIANAMDSERLHFEISKNQPFRGE